MALGIAARTQNLSIVIAGRDPAIHAENLLAQSLRAASYAGCHHGPRRGQSVVGSGATRGSTGELPIPACTFNAPISAADWKAIEAREKYILFNGFVRYEDAFHKYKWHFGDLYIVDGKFFSTADLPPAYNQETQEDQPK